MFPCQLLCHKAFKILAQFTINHNCSCLLYENVIFRPTVDQWRLYSRENAVERKSQLVALLAINSPLHWSLVLKHYLCSAYKIMSGCSCWYVITADAFHLPACFLSALLHRILGQKVPGQNVQGQNVPGYKVPNPNSVRVRHSQGPPVPGCSSIFGSRKFRPPHIHFLKSQYLYHFMKLGNNSFASIEAELTKIIL